MRFLMLLGFLNGVVFGQFQDIHFKEDEVVLRKAYQDKQFRIGYLADAASAFLDIMEAKEIEGYAKINNNILRGWELSNQDWVFESVQYIVKASPVSLVLTCLVRSDGSTIKGSMHKENDVIRLGEECWCFLETDTHFPINKGKKIMNDIDGDQNTRVSHSKSIVGTEKEIREFLDLFFSECSKSKRVSNSYKLQIGFRYRGTFKKGDEFIELLNKTLDSAHTQ